MSAYVLKPAKTAPSNATTTGAATSYVSRSHLFQSGVWVESHADQYRAHVMESGRGQVEYLLWAANSSNLAMLEDPSWIIQDGTGTIPVGEDPTPNLMVRDNGGREIAHIDSVHVRRGDNHVLVILTDSSFDQDPRSGLLTLNSTGVTSMGGGFSLSRGDVCVQVSYFLAAQHFWWTRNDSQNTRFAWNGLTQRWEPLKGASVQSLGVVAEQTYLLDPKPTRYVVGDTIQSGLLRVGQTPSDSSLYVTILVVTDEEAASTYTSFNPSIGAVLGVASGQVQLNPSLIAAYLGTNLWYAQEQFAGTGVISPLLDASQTYMAPIPGPTDYPFVRLGSRRYLRAIRFADDAALSAANLSESEVGWSQTSGWLKFSDVDLAKADPNDPGFEIAYLGAEIIYDGVALTTVPIGTKTPVQLVDGAGSPALVQVNNDLYVPLADSVNISGILFVPDGTGAIPVPGVPMVRPNGTGLVRTAKDGDSEAVFFGQTKSLTKTQVVDYASDIPALNFKIPSGSIYLALDTGKVGLGAKDRKAFAGKPLYFLQTSVTPSTYVTDPIVYSSWAGPFDLVGDEVLDFVVDGIPYQWDASVLGAGRFSAEDVSTSLNDLLVSGSCSVIQGRIQLQGFSYVSIGSTFSGCAVLGFNPGWDTRQEWLVDSGVSFGVFRSPQNLDRTAAIADCMESAVVRDGILQSDVLASSMLSVNNPPLLDIPGYAPDVFFQTVSGKYRKSLHSFQELYYQFEDSRMYWADIGSVSASVTAPTNTLTLGQGSVLGDTLYPSVGTGYGLYLAANGGVRVFQEPNVDYVLDEFSQVVLTTPIGPKQASGVRGSFTQGLYTFNDPEALFVSQGVLPGYRLKISSGTSYIVTDVVSNTELTLHVAFTSDGADVSWQIDQGYTVNQYDPGRVADIIYTDFNHLLSDPFTIRVLGSVGVVGVDTLVGIPRADHVQTVRYGLFYGSPEASVYPLQKEKLGVLSQSLVTPQDTHFSEGAFEIQVGDGVYTPTGVSVFTVGLTGDVVEYGLPGSGLDGQLNFGTDVLSERADSFVYYQQIFRDPVFLPDGVAEMDPVSGLLSVSLADTIAYQGVEAYLSTIMITENRQDAVISPMQGTVFLNTPVQSGGIVEVSYYPANVDGTQASTVEITEQLPLYVRQEVATYVDDHTWEINPSGKTLAPTGFQVWVDSRLQNYGNLTTVSLVGNQLRFTHPVTSSQSVLVNYAVLEAFGGEQSYAVSNPPVYRPPFRLAKGESSFVLNGDRNDIQPGMLLRLGSYPLYISSVDYDNATDTTMVGIFPTPTVSLGSSAPGNDVISFLTSGPVTNLVNGNPTLGPAGFLLSLSAVYQPVAKGQLNIVFEGDVTAFAVAGHLLEVGGYPYLVASTTYDDVGRFTSVHVTTPFIQNFVSEPVRISARPIYPPQPRKFLGVGVPASSVELVRFSNASPGLSLTAGVEYVVDSSTGDVELVYPYTDALKPGEWLQAYFLKERDVSPTVEDGAVIVPTYGARYTYITTPDTTNGYLHTQVLGSYTFRSPDSFYVRALPLADYQGEVAQIAIQRVASQNPNYGAIQTMGGSSYNWSFGNTPLLSEVRDVLDQDRVARQYISDYNDAIVYFEQVLETIQGDVVGDRDGKFRFFVGRGLVYAPPGYEDDITGYLNARFIWSDVFASANGSFGVIPTDPIVNPETANQDPVTLQVTGQVMNPWRLDYYIQQQDTYVLNDMDDVILRGKERAHLTYQPPLQFTVQGVFNAMWYPSILSRLYPEASLAFTTTYPGLNADLSVGDVGVYSFAKVVPGEQGPVLASTFNKDIGTVSNPSLGTIRGITGQTKVRERLPRARVWAYSATGFPDIHPDSTGPSIIATPLPLDQFPVNPETGWPDLSQLATFGGDLPDLTTGDVELSTPAWFAYDEGEDQYPQLCLGNPNGDTYQLGSGRGSITNAMGVPFNGSIPKGIFVESILAGCIVTFTDGSGSLTQSDEIVRVGNGVLLPFEPVKGDTLYVISPYAVDASGFSDPPTFTEMRKFAKNQPLLDVGVRERTGSFVDRSLPSIQDPAFPIKEMVNQKVANPLGCIEADVEFVNTMQRPHRFPALLGQAVNDSGDYSIPYLTVANTELDRLAQVSAAFNTLILDGATSATYPDEISAKDGVIYGSVVGSNPPATLITTQTLDPVFTPHSGVGAVRPYDLVLVETDQGGISAGATGILSVGAVSSHTIEPPRFVTASRLGDVIKYTFNNMMAHLGTGTGMVLSQVGPDTVLDISTVSGLVFNDGSGSPTGGLNYLFSPFGGNNNIFSINLFDQTTGALVETITYIGATGVVSGSLGGVVLPSAVVFNQKTIVFPALGFAGNLGVQFDFTLSVIATSTGSTHGYIDTDRLTFVEAVDLTSVLPRGTQTVAGVSVQGELAVASTIASASVCTVNRIAETNGGLPFTFLSRDVSGVIGTFSAGVGTVKVMGFEGHGNVPIIATAVRFSAVPSSQIPILTSTGTIPDGETYIHSVVGSVADAVPGDILTIRESAIGDGAVKSGTYLVRQVVEPNQMLPIPYQDSTLRAYAGNSTGWASLPFPILTGADEGLLEISVDSIQTVWASPSGYDFDSTGTLYLLLNPADLSQTVLVDYASFVVGSSVTFTTVSGSARTALGIGLSDAQLYASLTVGTSVGGMVFLPIQGNVGADTGVEIGGIATLTVAGRGGSRLYTAFGNLIDSTGGPPPSSNDIGVWVSDSPGGAYTSDSTVFLPDPRTPVYANTPMFLDCRGLDTLFAINVNGNPNLRTILPGCSLVATVHALAGLFLEPSFPLPTQDLGGIDALVVDAAHSLTRVGMRNAASFGLGSSEDVAFSVHRIRRFHQFDSLTSNLEPLRYVYETRRGTMVSYAGMVATVSNTQLGAITDADVNVHAGDVLRVLDTNGVVLDQAEIAAIVSANVVLLRTPGFTQYSPVGGEVYEVYLRQAPVPHTQSNEQLLQAITDQVLLESVAVPATDMGGKVSLVNFLEDDSVPDFTTLGIQVDDILLVDPAGSLQGPTGTPTLPEYGTRPFGDQSVSVRGSPTHVAGGPSQLDDNRGYYRIVDVNTGSLEVSGVTEFSGTSGDPVVFGAVGQEYAVLPEITDSGLTGGAEGQMDLRVTAPANGSNSYLGNYNSIQPFSYKVIRPNGLLSRDSVDFVLLVRERMLSWVEEMAQAYNRGSTYYLFQRDNQIQDVGDPTDASVGVGYASNLFITSFTGLTQYAPFANTSDCLSILDRRYWCLDVRLDKEYPPYSVAGDPYASFEGDYSSLGYTVGSGRPVEPDRIEDILDRSDELREQRYSWINFRANRVNGTLPTIDRFYASLPERILAQEELLRLKRSLGQ